MEALGSAAAAGIKKRRLQGIKVDSQILSMLIWSLAELQIPNTHLTEIILEEIEIQVSELNPRALANIVWAFGQLGICRPELMQRIGEAASLLVDRFDSSELLRFCWAYEQAGGKDKSWANAVASQRERTYKFPSIGLEVALNTKVPLTKATDSACTSVDELGATCDARFRSGMAMWEASFVLAEFLSRHRDFGQLAEVHELMGEVGVQWGS
eukprot:gnl/MRDRNA2_/MRDRNA2_31263_c0_seq1.p1 gnl/MRDRNA2_/MRDRNA2_31263_c0~~gnl/MRDRNA2_/MRDRNA2_31263_c0_seq1.p1  ORF type:complete len:219 (-),score=31.05 gnl/MRDRNA2_/MRDRNA2_31263_c0_seq1:617-1252(-)